MKRGNCRNKNNSQIEDIKKAITKINNSNGTPNEDNYYIDNEKKEDYNIEPVSGNYIPCVSKFLEAAKDELINQRNKKTEKRFRTPKEDEKFNLLPEEGETKMVLKKGLKDFISKNISTEKDNSKIKHKTDININSSEHNLNPIPKILPIEAKQPDEEKKGDDYDGYNHYNHYSKRERYENNEKNEEEEERKLKKIFLNKKRIDEIKNAEKEKKRNKIFEKKKRERAETKIDSPYFPKLDDQEEESIVDGLKSIGVESSYGYRAFIAKKNGIVNYKGSPEQNIKMLILLKRGRLLRP